MIIKMKRGATDAQVEEVERRIIAEGYTPSTIVTRIEKIIVMRVKTEGSSTLVPS